MTPRNTMSYMEEGFNKWYLPLYLPRTSVHPVMHTLNYCFHLLTAFSKIYCLLYAHHSTRFQGCISKPDRFYMFNCIYLSIYRTIYVALVMKLVATKLIFQFIHLVYVSKKTFVTFQVFTLGSNALVSTKRQFDVVIKSMESQLHPLLAVQPQVSSQ